MQKNINEGWTFVIDKIEVKSTGGFVHGWFLYYKVVTDMSPTPTERLVTHYLTPYNAPTVIRIPRFLFTSEANEDTVIDLEIGPKEIYTGLVKLFNLQYGNIPSPRIEVPLHTVPPSKREELLRKIKPWSATE